MYKVTDEDVTRYLSEFSEGRNTEFPAHVRRALQAFVDENDLRPGLTGERISAAVEAYNAGYRRVDESDMLVPNHVVRVHAREAGVGAFLKAIGEAGGTIREPKIVANPVQSAPVVTAKGESFRGYDFVPRPTDITTSTIGEHVVASRPVVSEGFGGTLLPTPGSGGWIYFRRIGNQTLGINISKIMCFEIDAEGCFNVETNEGDVYEVAESDRDIVLSHLMAALNVKDLTGGVE